MGVNGMLTAGEVLLQWWLPRGFNLRLMDYLLAFLTSFSAAITEPHFFSQEQKYKIIIFSS